MPTIKMKKGYPTSDGVMHDKHADAVKRQAEIDFHQMMAVKTDGEAVIITLESLPLSDTQVLREWLKYCAISAAPKSTPKKKSTVKK